MKKILISLSLGVILVAPIFVFADHNISHTIQQLREKIQALQAQLNTLQQLAQAQGGGTQQWCHTFNTNLRIGDSGDEVLSLQQALDKEGFHDVAQEWMGSGGVAVGFGEVTASAVSAFQQKYKDEILTPLGLKYGTGFVGKATRAKLNQLYGCGVTLPPVNAGRLQIESSSASIAVGGGVRAQAIFSPPMPKCPKGVYCAQVMPAPIPVVAEWTSSNPGVASIVDEIGSCMAIGCPVVTTVTVKGISNGTADIRAAYNSPSGAVLTATAKVTVGLVSSIPSVTVISPNGGEVWGDRIYTDY